MTEPAEAEWAAAATFPQAGICKEALLADLLANRHDDVDWRADRVFRVHQDARVGRRTPRLANPGRHPAASTGAAVHDGRRSDGTEPRYGSAGPSGAQA